MIPEERVTRQVDPEIMEELRESIKQHGILEPLLVAKVDDNYILIDGLHRMLVAKELGMDKVPVIIKEMSEAELLITNLIVNRQRGRSNPAQEAKILSLLVDKYGYSLREAAAKLGMSKTTAEKYYQIAHNLSSKVLEMLEQGLLSVGCAYWLSFIEDKNKQEEIAQAAVQYSYTVEQCKEAARQALNPEEPPPPGSWTFTEDWKPQRVPVKAYPCGEEVDPTAVTYIPIALDKLELVQELFKTLCETLQEQQLQLEQPSQQPTTTSTVVEQQPPPQTQQQQPQQQQRKDWWPW